MEYRRRSHSVYLLTYHIVFVTKYRKPVITGEIGDFMKNHAAYLCQRFQGELIATETDRDHIHLLVSLPPQVCPADLVRTLKTQLSKEVHLNTTYNAPGAGIPERGYSLMVTVILHCHNREQRDGKGKRVYQCPADRRTQEEV